MSKTGAADYKLQANIYNRKNESFTQSKSGDPFFVHFECIFYYRYFFLLSLHSGCLPKTTIFKKRNVTLHAARLYYL
jgi:hypothetical protein